MKAGLARSIQVASLWQQQWDSGFQDHKGDGECQGGFLLYHFEMPDRQGIKHKAVCYSIIVLRGTWGRGDGQVFRGKMGLAQQAMCGVMKLQDDGERGSKVSNKGKEEHWLN